MQKLIKGYPVVEGVRLSDGERRATAVRRPNGNIALTVEQVTRSGVESAPVLRGLARFWRAVFLPVWGCFAAGEGQTAVKIRPIDKKLAKALSLKPQTAACILTCAEVFVTVLAGLFLLPLLFSLFLGGIPMALVRTLFLALTLYRLARTRYLRRLAMYAGAEHKLRSAVLRGAGADYEPLIQSSRLCPGSDCGFALLTALSGCLLQSVLLSCGAAAWIWVPVLALWPGLVQEGLRLLEKQDKPFCAPVLHLQRLVVLEPHVEMLELAQVAYRALEEEA